MLLLLRGREKEYGEIEAKSLCHDESLNCHPFMQRKLHLCDVKERDDAGFISIVVVFDSILKVKHSNIVL